MVSESKACTDAQGPKKPNENNLLWLNGSFAKTQRRLLVQTLNRGFLFAFRLLPLQTFQKQAWAAVRGHGSMLLGRPRDFFSLVQDHGRVPRVTVAGMVSPATRF